MSIASLPRAIPPARRSTPFPRGEDPQVRVTTGWWSGSWCDKDFQPGNDDRLVDNGDGTWTLEISLADDPLVELIDAQHLLFTGDRYTPLKLYFLE